MTESTPVSFVRVALLVVGLLALVPLTIGFGVIGLLIGMLFVLLAAMAK